MGELRPDGARATRARSPSTATVTSEYSEPSACRDTAKQAYLISLKLPAKGTVCPVDQLPWGLPPGP